ncbi:peptidylprolyl isomerase [Candidatus Poriferisocius sp.]|uniref:peptidylprolyl isomerase n=1 Tax=Candidatus Poriferisocius sp. TaxID=3101276 RepID=UPI003B5A0A2D
MATNKRERQRQRRQVAQRRSQATAARGRLRSRGVRVTLIVLAIAAAVAIVYWYSTRGDDGPETPDPVAVEADEGTDGESAGNGGSPPGDIGVPPPVAGGNARYGSTPCPDFQGEVPRTTIFDTAPPLCLDPEVGYTAVFDTSAGEIRVVLDPAGSPNSVNAFAVLAGYGYYDGSAVFKTDPGGGYIKGGSPNTNTSQDPGPGFTVPADGNTDYRAGQLVWAPTEGAIGQFYLVAAEPFVSDEPTGDVLGEITAGGVDVVLDILETHVDDPETAFGGWPSPPVYVNSIDIQTTEPTPEGTIDVSNCPPADGSGPTVLNFDGPQPMCLDASKQYTAVFDTTAGVMRIALDTANTPITANNFAVLARYHYYDNTVLFRTDPGIGIIQGGSPHTNSPSDPGPGYTIVDEGSGFTYEPGQIVMARTAQPDSAGAQFFFAVNENTALLNNQGTYVVFGQMDEESLAVAEAILASHVDQPNNPLGGAPDPQVIVNSVVIEESG